MPTYEDVLSTERAFFDALIGAKADDLDGLLTDDFSLADLSGGLMSKMTLTEGLRSGGLQFDATEPAETAIRFYDSTAIVTGRTQMRGRLDGTPFSAPSRYTHVYVERQGKLFLAAAQGTLILQGGSGNSAG
jgi:Domain of unknown function (DUF4440)